jgi:outer membrane protein assembly factor BamB
VAGTLVAGNRNGLLTGLDPATGATRWRMLFWGSSVESDAAPAGGSLFCIGSSDLRRVSLMDAADGRVLWRTDVLGWAWPRPAVTANRVFVSTSGFDPYQIRHLGGLCAVDRQTGKICWRWPAPEAPGVLLQGFVAAPVSAGRLILVGGLGGTLYAFPQDA